MSRIGARLSGVERLLLNRLQQTNAALTISSLRLATGKKINSAADNPSAFTRLSSLQTELKVVDKTASNIAAASSRVSKTQLALDSIRTQLNLIRTKAVEDEAGGLNPTTRAANQTAIDAAINEINRLATSDIDGRRILDGSADFRVSGRNSSQVSEVEVYSIGGSTLLTEAVAAELTYSGTNGLITDAATITITGNQGSIQLSVATTDSLAEVVRSINGQTGATGVRAKAEGDTLRIFSQISGDAGELAIVVDSGTFNVSGGNGDGTADGKDAVYATEPTISGSVTQAATTAQLVYTGSSSQISTGNATFILTGERGTTSIAVTANQNLTEVADAINLNSHKTGITAVAVGNSLTFNSVDYGSNAKIEITDSVGSFVANVSGGNEDGTANGINAIVEINGRQITGKQDAKTASLTHFESSGTITFNTTFTVTGNLGSRVISLNASDTLSAAKTAINLETNNTGVTATVSGDGKTLTFSSQTTGGSAYVAVDVTVGTFAIDGGNGDATANGSDAVTGNNVDGNRFVFSDNKLQFAIEFAAGFSGTFDPITLGNGGALVFALSTDVGLSSTLGIGSLLVEKLGGISGTIDQLLTGGDAAGLNTNAQLAIRIVDEALGELDLIEGRVDGFFDSTITSAENLISGFQENINDSIDLIDKVDTNEEALLIAKNQALIDNTISAMAILDQQRLSVVALIKQIAGL